MLRDENIVGLQQLQKSANRSDAESKLKFRRRTTQSILAIFERHAFFRSVEITCHIGHVARSNEECYEKLSDMTPAINLIICILLSASTVSYITIIRPVANYRDRESQLRPRLRL